MVQPINVNPVDAGAIASPSSVTASPSTGKSFMDMMLESLDEVNRLQTDADQGVQALYTGKTDDVASVLTAVNKAGIAFDLLMEIRNKLTDAYREIQQIRV